MKGPFPWPGSGHAGSRDLHASAAAGWLVTATQLGYAAGTLLVEPLGDAYDRRRLIPAMLLCSAVALLGCAPAPSFGILLVAITLLGVTTVSGQLLAPLGGDLAEDDNRGSVVGTVGSGILTGILVSRTISGLIAGAGGRRTLYVAPQALTRRRPPGPGRPTVRGLNADRCALRNG
ncbi:MFS transporter [Streptomyces incarnatus]|uniref:MFS transporter n=1 Tax=Streptomyces incarnatus TaxID=665007 RepID=UPI000A4E9E2D|nr:MFS transporter [Streptomyces incarnatus]